MLATRWQTGRFAVLERDAFTCRYCGQTPLQHGVVLEVDHIIPASKGGTDTLDNMITSCHDCNMGKLDKSLALPAHAAVQQYVNQEARISQPALFEDDDTCDS